VTDIIEISVTPNYLDSSEDQDTFIEKITCLGCIKVGGSFFSGDYAPTYYFLCDKGIHLLGAQKLVEESENASMRVKCLNSMFRTFAYKQIASAEKLKEAKERYSKALNQLSKGGES
jgi:hypothetical protein